MPLSTEVFQEGIRIPPIKIMVDGRVHHDLLQLILANVRTPREREGDLTASAVESVIETSGVQAVLFASGRLDQLPGFRDWVAAHFVEVEDFGHNASLFVRNQSG